MREQWEMQFHYGCLRDTVSANIFTQSAEYGQLNA